MECCAFWCLKSLKFIFICHVKNTGFIIYRLTNIFYHDIESFSAILLSFTAFNPRFNFILFSLPFYFVPSLATLKIRLRMERKNKNMFRLLKLYCMKARTRRERVEREWSKIFKSCRIFVCEHHTLEHKRLDLIGKAIMRGVIIDAMKRSLNGQFILRNNFDAISNGAILSGM